MNNIRSIVIFEPISEKMINDLNQIFVKISAELADNIGYKTPEKLFGRHTTTGYFELEQRYFKTFISVELIPVFKITKQDITEVTEAEMILGIDAEQAKPDTTTYWKETQIDE